MRVRIREKLLRDSNDNDN